MFLRVGPYIVMSPYFTCQAGVLTPEEESKAWASLGAFMEEFEGTCALPACGGQEK